MRFDANKCDGGLQALGWYHEKQDDKRDIGLGPDHDWSSHSADAFGLGCIAHAEPQGAASPKPQPQFAGRPGGWMAGR
jgi:phage terminase large subunit